MLRYHGIQVAQSSIHRILQRHKMNRLPNNRRKYERQKTKWKRYEKQPQKIDASSLFILVLTKQVTPISCKRASYIHTDRNNYNGLILLSLLVPSHNLDMMKSRNQQPEELLQA